MEITSFILGVCAVIGIAVVILVVVGMVKIYRQKQQIENLQSELGRSNTNIYQSISDETRYINDRLSRMDDRAMLSLDELKRDILSYVDSRIDKLQAKKEVIKG